MNPIAPRHASRHLTSDEEDHEDANTSDRVGLAQSSLVGYSTLPSC